MPFPPAGVRPGEGPGTTGRGFGRLLIGVCHLGPLPGAPRYAGAIDDVIARACEDARALADGGVDLVVVENFGDAPFYPGRVPAETVAAQIEAGNDALDYQKYLTWRGFLDREPPRRPDPERPAAQVCMSYSPRSPMWSE